MFWPSRLLFLWPSRPGQRVSALHALSNEPGHVRVGTCWSFVWYQDRTSLLKINLRLLSRLRFSCLLCRPSLPLKLTRSGAPVRALKWYLDRTKSKRSSTSLFVFFHCAFQSHFQSFHFPDGLSNVSQWLVLMPLFSCRFRAHDTRSVSFFLGSLQRRPL